MSKPNSTAQKPRLLDLFCGAGGAAKGYHDAGFEVVGVDINPQPHYPYQFIQADALDVLEQVVDGMSDGWVVEDLGFFSTIHASPPCQRYSDLAKRNGNEDAHPDLIGPVRELLQATGLPYVIENVDSAPLIRKQSVMLCGSMFGLGVDGYRLRRHRRFEFSITPPALLGTNCKCAGDSRPVIDVTGGGPTKAPRLDAAGGRTYKGTADQARAAMGIDWMTKKELNEAIPPAYTEWVGNYLLEQMAVEAAA